MKKKAKKENKQRVERIEELIIGTEYEDAGDAPVIDLLTDLQHYASAKKIDFENCLRMARQHFIFEDLGEG